MLFDVVDLRRVAYLGAYFKYVVVVVVFLDRMVLLLLACVCAGGRHVPVDAPDARADGSAVPLAARGLGVRDERVRRVGTASLAEAQPVSIAKRVRHVILSNAAVYEM